MHLDSGFASEKSSCSAVLPASNNSFAIATDSASFAADAYLDAIRLVSARRDFTLLNMVFKSILPSLTLEVTVSSATIACDYYAQHTKTHPFIHLKRMQVAEYFRILYKHFSEWFDQAFHQGV